MRTRKELAARKKVLALVTPEAVIGVLEAQRPENIGRNTFTVAYSIAQEIGTSVATIEDKVRRVLVKLAIDPESHVENARPNGVASWRYVNTATIEQREIDMAQRCAAVALATEAVERVGVGDVCEYTGRVTLTAAEFAALVGRGPL